MGAGKCWSRSKLQKRVFGANERASEHHVDSALCCAAERGNSWCVEDGAMNFRPVSKCYAVVEATFSKKNCVWWRFCIDHIAQKHRERERRRFAILTGARALVGSSKPESRRQRKRIRAKAQAACACASKLRIPKSHVLLLLDTIFKSIHHPSIRFDLLSPSFRRGQVHHFRLRTAAALCAGSF